MYAIERKVGGLVEIRIWSPVSLDEVGTWAKDHDAVIDAIPGRYVCLVDLVDATVFPQEVVDGYVATMRNEPRLRRTATLLAESPTLGLQIQRMLREANNPERRSFRDIAALEAWLGEVLTPAERARLSLVLDARRRGPASGRRW